MAIRTALRSPHLLTEAPRAVLMLLGITAGLLGCSTSSKRSEPAATASAVGFNQELRDELVGMLKRDQNERTGGPIGEGDAARTERLKEIIEQHGWPTLDLVGKRGEDAAWAIAQHSDLDPEFQRGLSDYCAKLLPTVRRHLAISLT